MQKNYKAKYVIQNSETILENFFIEITDNIITNLTNEAVNDSEVIDLGNVAIMPGFVNAHCHLELSHLYGAIKKGNGLLDFIISVKNRRNFDKENILKAIASAEQQMIHNGIVAVGDICNTSDTLTQKKIGNIKYYNFIFIIHSKLYF